VTYRLDDGRTVGIAHDYLTQRGGAERVVLALARAFPGAPVHTTLYDPPGTYPEFAELDVRVSPLNRVGPLRRSHRAALPVLHLASEALTPTEDVVIASTSGWAHGIHAGGDVVAYCHSPARWLYQSEDYLGGPLWASARGVGLGAVRPMLRRWDARAARRPARYLANSRIVRQRIADAYGIDATVVPAPHSMDPSAPQAPVPELEDWAEQGFHLVVSRLLPYKNVHVLLDAVRGTDHRLVVVGSGPDRDRIRADLTAGVRLVSHLTDAQMRWVYAHATLLLAPSLEDYGLTPIEAAAFGVPSVTLRAGGYLDTVVEGVTGLHADLPEPGPFLHGIEAALAHPWDRDAIRAHAATFSEERFAERIRAVLDEL
jgi:glycosyltransferase involved in cell wall biosynthesis